MYRFLALCGLLSLGSILCFAQQWPQPNCTVAGEPFDRQYGNVFQAYKKGDENALKKALDDFSLPPDWFTAHFGAEKGAEFQKAYADQFAYFELMELRKFHWIDKADESTIELQVCAPHALKPPAKPAPASLVPIPDIQMISGRYTKVNGTFSMFGKANIQAHSTSWGNLYGKVDGQYKFFGLGGYPFWDPARIRLADMCGKEGESNGGELVKRVEPEYPEDARKEGKQGTVLMRVSIGKDGSVTDVEIMDGDPAFIPAAKAAVMQWHYKPYINCGEPVEMRTIESVKFTPPPPTESK